MPRRCWRLARPKPPAIRRPTATIMSAYFGDLPGAAGHRPAGRFLAARVPSRLLERRVRGGRAPSRRSAADDCARAAGIAFRSDGEIACRARSACSRSCRTRPSQLDPAFPVDRAEEQLIKPDVAAELAARHLEQNLALFNGALAPAIASYNADKERVQVWWDAAKGPSLPGGSAVRGQHSVSADARVRSSGARQLRDVSALRRTTSIPAKITAIATAIRGVKGSRITTAPRITASTGVM